MTHNKFEKDKSEIKFDQLNFNLDKLSTSTIKAPKCKKPQLKN